MQLQALTKVFENWGAEIDDFLISYQLDVGPDEVDHASDLFTFDVVSPKRLNKILITSEVEIGRGYLIMNDFDENKVMTTVKRLIRSSYSSDFELSLVSLSRYFRWVNDN